MRFIKKKTLSKCDLAGESILHVCMAAIKNVWIHEQIFL